MLLFQDGISSELSENVLLEDEHTRSSHVCLVAWLQAFVVMTNCTASTSISWSLVWDVINEEEKEEEAAIANSSPKICRYAIING